MALRADEATAAEKFSTAPTDSVNRSTRREQALALGELVDVAAASSSSTGNLAGRSAPAVQRWLARRHRRDHTLV
jgi:hypothetical protein